MRFAQIFEGDSGGRMFEAENTGSKNPKSGSDITFEEQHESQASGRESEYEGRKEVPRAEETG